MKGDQLYRGERPAINLARLKMGGEKFEVVIDPDAAMEFRAGKQMDIREVVHSEKIFSDAHKGLHVSEHTIRNVFKTDDSLEILKTIISRGEIQLTPEYREKLREQKLRSIIQTIHRNGVDPKTNLPHPPQRIANAMAEAKVHIDEHKRAEDQIQDVLRKIRTVLPIRFESRRVSVAIPVQYASKAHQTIRNYGTIIREEWQSDGSLTSVIELPAGLQQEFFDAINKLTHGHCETKILKAM